MVGDLAGEFAGRRKDQHRARRRRLGAAIGGISRSSERQREGRGLAGAGLGDAEQVAALEDERDRLGLDRRRNGIVLGGERAEQRRRQAEIGEFGQM